MRQKKIQPGYLVSVEAHEIVKEYAKQLTDSLGFPVSHNKALELLIKRGDKEIKAEEQRG